MDTQILRKLADGDDFRFGTHCQLNSVKGLGTAPGIAFLQPQHLNHSVSRGTVDSSEKIASMYLICASRNYSPRRATAYLCCGRLVCATVIALAAQQQKPFTAGNLCRIYSEF